MIQKLWDIVNSANTIDEIEDAIVEIKATDVDNETYDELMNALAYKSREAYHSEKKRGFYYD